MYLIHEENHSNLCVANNITTGILWLVTNDWLDGNTVGVDEEGWEFTVGEVLERANENPLYIYLSLYDLFVEQGADAVLEWLEQFGFYFHKIEVA